MENQNNYEKLLGQVNEILTSIEQDSLPIDALSEKLEEAYVLVDTLKTKLFETELKIKNIIDSRNRE